MKEVTYPKFNIKTIDNIPQELRDIPAWVLWGTIPDPANKFGKPKKPPFHALTLRPGLTQNEKIGVTFDDALESYKKNADRQVSTSEGTATIRGIGFAFYKENRIVGIDLDNKFRGCIDANGKTEQWVDDILEFLPASYVELSPSLGGLHIFFHGSVPKNVKKSDIEIFHHSGYLTFTGIRFGKSPITVAEGGEHLAEFFSSVAVDDKKAKQTTVKPESSEDETLLNLVRAIPDDELWEIMLNAKGDIGERIKLFKAGEWDKAVDPHGKPYGSQSEADLSMCIYLASITRNDPKRMDMMFRQTGMFRDKWDERHGDDTYGNNTIAKAIIADHKLFNPAAGDSCNDIDNARLFAEQHSGQIIFASDRGIWLEWTGSLWFPDAKGGATRRARITVHSLRTKAKDNKVMKKWAEKCRTRGKIEAMLALGESEPEIEKRVFADTFDVDPMLFNVANGILNLRTAQLEDHRSDAFLTKISEIIFNAQSKCPKFHKFIDRTFLANPEIVTFMQRLLGYFLTGKVSEKGIFFFYGGTDTGKSTLIRIMRGILGDYGVALPSEFLIEKRYGNIGENYALADLAGARFAACVETGQDRMLDVNRMKSLTGGDAIRARNPYEKNFEFEPQAKLVIGTNNRPQIKETDGATWRRIVIVPFREEIPKDEQNPMLADMLLEEESPGILAWAVQGCIEWQKFGLQTPEVIQKEVESYREQEDIVAQFFNENTEPMLNDPVKIVDAYQMFRRYTHTLGYSFMNIKRFKAEALRLGYKARHTMKGDVFDGVRLTVEAQKDLEADPPPF